MRFLDEGETFVPRPDDPSDPGPACAVCASKDEVYPSRVLLCDCTGCQNCAVAADNSTACFRAYHMACLEPKLLRKPKGDWLCPECKGASPAGEDVDSAAFPCMEDGPWTDDPLNPTLYNIPEEPLIEAQHAPAPVDATPPCAAGIRGSTRVRKPVQRYSPIFLMLHILKCADTFIDNATIHGYEPDPTTLSEALSSRNADEWVAATVSEMTSLMEKGTFDIVDRTPDMKPISAKWVFKSKFDAFGFLVKRKARLVCRGFLQTYGVDYYDVFSPVSKQATLRTLLAYAAANDLEIEQIDINVAFLNADLDETVYVDIPPGLEGVYPGKTMKLHKALYGLKQAPGFGGSTSLPFCLSMDLFLPCLTPACLSSRVSMVRFSFLCTLMISSVWDTSLMLLKPLH